MSERDVCDFLPSCRWPLRSFAFAPLNRGLDALHRILGRRRLRLPRMHRRLNTYGAYHLSHVAFSKGRCIPVLRRIDISEPNWAYPVSFGAVNWVLY